MGLLFVSFISLVLVLMETELFKAGYASTLFKRFARVIGLMVVYFVISVGLFILSLVRGSPSSVALYNALVLPPHNPLSV